jgi:XisI protein
MDRGDQLKRIARETVAAFEAAPTILGEGVVSLFVADDEHGNYLEMTTGFHNHYSMYGIQMHLRVADGKILIEHDGTAGELREMLADAGVQQHEIVRAYQEEELLAGKHVDERRQV